MTSPFPIYTPMCPFIQTATPGISGMVEMWIYTKKVDKYDKIEDKQRRHKNVRKEKQ